MNSSKEQQGDELMAQGDKCVTKNFWRWSEDWEGASVAYEKAATAYKNCKQQEKAKTAFVKAADAQSKCNLLHSAGKSYENAGDLAVGLKQLKEAVQLYQNAAHMFSTNGTGERAGDSLAKAAKALENEDPEAALNLYLEVVECYESEETGMRKAIETIRKAVNLMLQQNKLDEVTKLLNKQIELDLKSKQKADLPKAYLSSVIVHLANNDVVAAGKAYDSYLSTEGFTQSKECIVAGQLLDAFETGSIEALKACLNQQVFSFLPNQITKLARDLTVSGATTSGGAAREKKEKDSNEDEDDLAILL